MMNAAVAADMFSRLSDAGQTAVLSYMRYLINMEGQMKESKARQAFEEFAQVLEGDTGWKTEEEMLEDLAEFRRKRQGL